MMLRRLRSLLDGVRFLIINLRIFSTLPRFSERPLAAGTVVRACKPREVGEIVTLRKQLDGHEFSWAVQLLLRLVPEKCCVVVTAEHGGLNALSCFYFNERDIHDATVHEGFIGVRPGYAGKGVATGVRRFAADHFSRISSLRGISSRVSLSNAASAASGAKSGYELLESYKDEVTGEERGYFINRFRCGVRE